MAKLTNEQWQLAKMDYEVHGLSYSDLVKKYGMSKGSISSKAKNENWQQGKTEHLIQKKVNVIKELQETEQRIEQLEPIVQKSIEHEVHQRLLHEKIFIDSAMNNQDLANRYLQLCENEVGAVDLDDLNKHSQLTARNKETVLGKQPETAIQVNTQVNAGVQSLTPEIAQAINAKLEDEY